MIAVVSPACGRAIPFSGVGASLNTSAGEVSTADAGIFGLGARCVDELVDDGVGAAITVGVSVLPLVLPYCQIFLVKLKLMKLMRRLKCKMPL